MAIEEDRCPCGYYFDDDEAPTHFLLSASDAAALASSLAGLAATIERDFLELRYTNEIEGEAEWLNKCPECGRLLVCRADDGVDVVDVYAHQATEQVDCPEPLSTASDQFLGAVEGALAANGSLRLLIRYPRSGGHSDYFVIRHRSDLDDKLGSARPAWAFSADLDFDRYLVGVASPDLDGKALALLEKHDELWVWRVVSAQEPLSRAMKITSEQQLKACLSAHGDCEVLVSAGFRLNARTTLTAYVPDADGVVRPSAY